MSTNAAASEIMNNQPGVSENVVNDEKANSEKAPVDKYGRTFDPDLHKVDAAGVPLTSDKTKLLHVKPGKVKSAKPKPGDSAFIPPTSAGDQARNNQANNDQEAAATGMAMASMIFLVGQQLGGEEWKPLKNEELGLDESDVMNQACVNYCKAKGVRDIPPGWALVIALSMYSLPRLNKPKTSNRIKAGWYYLKSKISRKTNGTQSDTGNDGKRENKSSEATGNGVFEA